MHFSQNIRALRKSKGMAQEQLADELDTTKSTVSLYELGKSFPTFDRLLKLAKLFDVSLDSLVFYDLSGGNSYVEDSSVRYGIPLYEVEGQPKKLGDAGSRFIQYLEIPIEHKEIDLVGLEVSGNAAYPEVSKGDIAVCEKHGKGIGPTGRLWYVIGEGLVPGFYRVLRQDDNVVELGNNQVTSVEVPRGNIREALKVVRKVTEEGLV